MRISAFAELQSSNKDVEAYLLRTNYDGLMLVQHLIDVGPSSATSAHHQCEHEVYLDIVERSCKDWSINPLSAKHDRSRF